MSGNDEDLHRLDLVRTLLLNPTSQSMLECQRLLSLVTGSFTKRPADPALATEIRKSVEMIRFLLDQAAAFWHVRSSAGKSTPDYTQTGRLLQLPQQGNLSVEI